MGGSIISIMDYTINFNNIVTFQEIIVIFYYVY
jgi:hypothetical protein